MIDRVKLRQLGGAIKRPFQLAWCILVCRTAPAEYDPNTHRWNCTKCGTNWGND